MNREDEAYMPTEEEIAAMTAEIRAKWTPGEKYKRSGGVHANGNRESESRAESRMRDVEDLFVQWNNNKQRP